MNLTYAALKVLLLGRIDCRTRLRCAKTTEWIQVLFEVETLDPLRRGEENDFAHCKSIETLQLGFNAAFDKLLSSRYLFIIEVCSLYLYFILLLFIVVAAAVELVVERKMFSAVNTQLPQ